MRVVTYNIWNGGAERIGAIEDVLRTLDADVVALQEANNRAAVETMAKQLGMQLVYGEANSEWAVAWLSKLPILRSRNHRLPVLAKTLLEIEVEGARLFATHLVHGHSREDASRRTAEVCAILELVKSGSVLTGDFNAVHPQD